MAAPNVANILRVPGDLIWNPTDLGNPPAYGGTYLGLSKRKEFVPQPILRPVWDEVWGAVRDMIYCGERPMFRAVLRYQDTDAISTIAFQSVSSGSSGIRWLFRPGGSTQNTRAGTSLGANSGTLLFAARARTDHPFILMRNAIPAFDEALRLQMSLGREQEMAVAFWLTPNSSGQVYEVARRANLAL